MSDVVDPEAVRTFMESMIPFNRFLGFKVTIAKPGFARFELPFRDELIGDPHRPALHGGVLSALADTAGGTAVLLSATDSRARLSTIDLRIDYLRPARLATVFADATVVRMGHRVGVADVRMFHPDKDDVTIATGKGVYNVIIKKEKT